MTTATMPFDARTSDLLAELERSGQIKHLQMIDSPMDAEIRLRQPDGSFKDALCFCSNNYLGLANHPEVVEAGIQGLRDFGAGTASVRFICGTFTPHETLEQTIADYMGTEASYTFVSCWTASEAFFPTCCEKGDVIISEDGTVLETAEDFVIGAAGEVVEMVIERDGETLTVEVLRGTPVWELWRTDDAG